jgi:CRP-like cAMP-binding protein
VRKLIEGIKWEFFESGEVIIKEGDASNEKLYFILKGSVLVIRGIN